jgi:hypothetical protein
MQGEADRQRELLDVESVAGHLLEPGSVFWRRRLAASDRPQRIFEVIREVITETGAVAGKQRRARHPLESLV